jgi:1-acyl-sn-glycerol-3-phosphate acyltransferase
MAARPNLTGRLFYDFCYWSSYIFFTFGFSFRRRGWANVPEEGPLLLVSNHASMFDPIVVGLSTRRYLSFLARKNLFEQPVVAPLIRNLNAIPIDRGMGKDGIQAVLHALGEGQAVLVFPEGERTHTGQLQPLKAGISLLIKRVHCPIIPVGVAGSYAAWNRFAKLPRFSPIFLQPEPSTIAVSIGKPIDPERYRGMEREGILADLHREIGIQWAEGERLRRKL